MKNHAIIDHKLPSILGLGVIVIGVIVTTFLVKGGNLLESKAGPKDIPSNIQITNLSSSSFTVTYMTSNETVGTINEGGNPENLNKVVLDDRDQISQKINKYQSHSITANNLDPETTYYFTITSGSKSITNNGKPFSVKTGSVISTSPSSQIPLSGKVINPDGTFPSDGLVLVKIAGSQNLSTFLKADGSYTVPLNNLRSEDLNSYTNLNNNSINIKIISNNLTSSVDVSPNEISPVPLITLSNNYDFSENPEPTPTKISPTSTASFKDMKFPKASKIIKKSN